MFCREKIKHQNSGQHHSIFSWLHPITDEVEKDECQQQNLAIEQSAMGTVGHPLIEQYHPTRRVLVKEPRCKDYHGDKHQMDI
jgi:hypothetical protein